MASGEYPEIWTFFRQKLVPGYGMGYGEVFLKDKFEGMINDLLDSKCKNEEDICGVLSSYAIVPSILDDNDIVTTEIDNTVKHIYGEEFEDLYTTYILPIKSERSDDEQSATENGSSEDENESSDNETDEDN
jgi:hypothetical protein